MANVRVPVDSSTVVTNLEGLNLEMRLLVTAACEVLPAEQQHDQGEEGGEWGNGWKFWVSHGSPVPVAVF